MAQQTWLCVLCEKDVTEDDYRREVDCPNNKCPGRVYHEDCIANYLKKTKYSKDRCTGFPCPVVLPTGKQCPGYVCKMHSFFPTNQKKKAARVAAAAQAAAQAKAKPPPIPQPKPKQAGVVAAISAMKSGAPQPVAIKSGGAKPLAVMNGNAPATAAAAPRLIPGLTGAYQDPAALRAQVAKLRAEARSPAMANNNPNKAGAGGGNRAQPAGKAGSFVEEEPEEERAPRQVTLWDAIGSTGLGAAGNSGLMEAANLNIYTMEQHGRAGGNFSALLQRRKQGGGGCGGGGGTNSWKQPRSSVHDLDGSDSDGGSGSCDAEGTGLDLDLSHANSSLLLSPGGGGGMTSPRSATDVVTGFPALPTKDPPPPAFHVSNPNANTVRAADGAPRAALPSGDYVDDDADILALVAAAEEKERQQQEALRREIELQQRQLASGAFATDFAAAAASADLANLTHLTDPTIIAATDAVTPTTDSTAAVTTNSTNITHHDTKNNITNNNAAVVAAAADPVVAYDIVYTSEGQEVVLEPTSNAYYRLEDVFGVPRSALVFANCPGEDGNLYRCVAVTASMAAARAALAQAWLEAQQEQEEVAARAATAATVQQQQQLVAAVGMTGLSQVITASELMFGVPQQQQQLAGAASGLGGGADAALLATKTAAAAASPYGGAVGKGGGGGGMQATDEDDDTDVSDLMALLCA